MKKFVAILTALMFALSLGAAVAQEKAPAAAGEAKKEAPVKKEKKAKKAKKEKKAETPAPAAPVAAPAAK